MKLARQRPVPVDRWGRSHIVTVKAPGLSVRYDWWDLLIHD